MKVNEKVEISDLHVITVNCVTTENSARETTFLRRKERKFDTPEDLKKLLENKSQLGATAKISTEKNLNKHTKQQNNI